MGFEDEIRAQIKREAGPSPLSQEEQLLREAVKVPEKGNHLKLREQATSFRERSGIGILVKTLGEILAAERVSNHSKGKSLGPDYVMRVNVGYGDYELPKMPLDLDSTLDMAIWDVLHYAPTRYEIESTEGGLRFLAVETSPFGNIIFHTFRKEIQHSGLWEAVAENIEESVWESNPKILEETLTRTFCKPGTIKFKVPPKLYQSKPIWQPYG